MKKLLFRNLFALALLSFSAMAFGQSFESPILITSAGQSADVKLVKMLAARQKLEATTILMAKTSDLEGVKTLIIVPGFSSKGLGAAGISQEDEFNRVSELVKAANDRNIPIVMMHVGGNARRFGQSDAFNTLVANNSKHMIVVAQGDEDQFFTKIANSKKIPMDVVEKIAESGEPMAKLFE
ncbi:MAG: DUF6305 family protein [Bacteroidales bacterium]|nr:DUF6305 family protein [Bacteroidales bacterium]MCF8406017.1 DUF6305 family protein [Bacteroidales bacterium]